MRGATAGALVMMLLAGAIPLLFGLGLLVGPGQPSYACGAAASTSSTTGSTASFDQEQIANARTIITVGQAQGVPAYGWVIAIAAAIQESGLRNLPYGDRDSLGLFQQRPSTGWGTPAQIMDPTYAATKFYEHLLALSGWQQMPVTVAAQDVQHSAYPDAYAAHEGAARSLVARLASDAAVAATVACSSPSAGNAVVMPLPAGSYVDQNNYGQTSSHWAAFHTGDDFSAPCGTPVLAATSGTIHIESGGGWSWSGRWLVKVKTAPGALTTWYAHMQTLTVTDGQKVSAGQQIGQVGNLGNATGCHLHFEVHPHDGGYLQDQIDPVPWLAANVGDS